MKRFRHLFERSTTPVSNKAMPAPEKSAREKICELLFRPLDPKQHEVRLIHLQPAAEFDSPISCTLETVSLSKNIFFTAVSWCWGIPDLDGSVTVNGYPWSVTSNLETALRYLRYTNKARTIWVDALCVNQSRMNSAVVERNHQIQLMKLIFSMSPQIVVWLGVPTRELELFVNDTILTGSLEPSPRRTALDIAEGIIDLLSLPWWSRLWVVQEAVLGSKVEVQLGNARFIFHFLVDDIHSFWEGHTEEMQSDVKERLQAKLRSIDIFLQLRNQHAIASDIRQSIYNATDLAAHNRSTDIVSRFPKTLGLIKSKTDVPLTLVQLLEACRSRDASDAHDKVYGLLGLLSPDAAAALQPDYAEPVNIMYIRMVNYFIHQDLLAFLSQALPSLRNPAVGTLPTWTPDWTITAEMSSTVASPFQYRSTRFSPEVLEIDRWLAHMLAAGNRPSVHRLVDEAHHYSLETPGIFIDTVSRTSKKLPGISSLYDWNTHLSEWQSVLCAGISSPRLDQESVNQFNIGLTPNTLDDFMLESQRAILHSRYYPGGRDKPGVLTGGWIGRAYWDTVSYSLFNMLGKFDNLVNVPKHQSLSRLLAKATENRRLFFSQDDHIGNGPHNMQENDAIFYLPGLNLPCLLRPVSGSQNTYTFVGECYLEMYDEAPCLFFEARADHRSRADDIFDSHQTLTSPALKKKLLVSRYEHLQAFTSISII